MAKGRFILSSILQDTRFGFLILPIAGEIYVKRSGLQTMTKLKNENKENGDIENSTSEAFQNFALGFLVAQCEQEKVQIDAKYGPVPLKLERIDDEVLRKIIFYNQLSCLAGNDLDNGLFRLKEPYRSQIEAEYAVEMRRAWSGSPASNHRRLRDEYS